MSLEYEPSSEPRGFWQERFDGLGPRGRVEDGVLLQSQRGYKLVNFIFEKRVCSTADSCVPGIDMMA